MTKIDAPKRDALDKTITACLQNGTRLLDESYDLEFREPIATRLYLILIAQEEFAKAFILYLVREQIAPLNPSVQRAIKDHTCKQLVGMILDYMIMHWEELDDLRAMIDRDLDLEGRLPYDIASALEILCYEKISRWTKNNWMWDEEPTYDRQAIAISKGQKDRRKQNALYVGIGKMGEVCSTPAAITSEEVDMELERARRYHSCVSAAQRGEETGYTLLGGTDLKVETNSAGVLMVRSKNARAASNEGAANSGAIETVVVTGSLIPGAVPASPVQTLTSDDIRASGYATLAEVLKATPQNFGGGTNSGIGHNDFGRAVGSGNISQSDAPDLRGLGADATLTLLDGHRMSFGDIDNATDLGLIPTIPSLT